MFSFSHAFTKTLVKIMVNSTYLDFWETCKYLCSFWRAVLHEKIWYLGKIKKIFSSKHSVQKFSPPGLMHYFSFWSISECLHTIVAYESLSCPQWEKMDFKFIQSYVGFATSRIHCEKGSNTQNMLDNLKDVLIMNNYKKKTAVDHPG